MMRPLVIAAFRNQDCARAAFDALTDAGVLQDDLSLVLRRPLPGVLSPSFLEKQDRPSPLASVFGHSAFRPKEAEGSFIFESRIGGGISTSGDDDDAAGVEELDDAQSVSEDMTYPLSGRSYGSEDAEEVEHFSETGFLDTTRPPAAVKRRSHADAPTDFASPLLGEILGEGSLATTLTFSGITGSKVPFVIHLASEGLPIGEAKALDQLTDRGGCVLAVDVPAVGPQIEDIEAILSGFLPVRLITHHRG